MACMRWAAVIVAALLVAGCSAQPDESIDLESLHDTLTGIPDLAGLTAAEADEFAESACRLVAAAIEAGSTNEQAVDRVFATLVDAGMSGPDALLATVASVGYGCPLDITE